MSNQLEILPSQLHFKPFKLDELEVRSYAMIPFVREALVNVHGTYRGRGGTMGRREEGGNVDYYCRVKGLLFLAK